MFLAHALRFVFLFCVIRTLFLHVSLGTYAVLFD